MEWLKIILLCVAAAIVYGICQDMITTRVCVEYFTIGHPPIFGGTENPTLLALGWGVIATWWVGLGLGVPTAFFARIGSRPRMTWREVKRPILILMAIVGVSAVLAGVVGYLIWGGFIRTYFPEIPAERADMFAADAFAHESAYFVGFIGGVLTWGWIWWQRRRLSKQLSGTRTRSERGA
jgi:hypothetical protein